MPTGRARRAHSPQLKREWAPGTAHARAQGRGRSACRYGGFAAGKRKATGFFRVEKIGERWWFIDPEGCRFWSAGVNGAGADPPRTQIVGRDKLFASIPDRTRSFPRRGAGPDPLRDPVSFYVANLQKRFGERLACSGGTAHRRGACAPGD